MGTETGKRNPGIISLRISAPLPFQDSDSLPPSPLTETGWDGLESVVYETLLTSTGLEILPLLRSPSLPFPPEHQRVVRPVPKPKRSSFPIP